MSPLAGIGAIWLGNEAMKAGSSLLEAFNPAKLFAADEKETAQAADAGSPSLRDLHRLEEEVAGTLSKLHGRIKQLAEQSGVDLGSNCELSIDSLGQVTATGENADAINAILANDPEAQSLAGYLSAAQQELRAGRDEPASDSGDLLLRWTEQELAVVE